MLTQAMSVDAFAANMDKLINCQYVLSAKKISNLLKGISLSRLFYELFGYCSDGFDYAAARKKYFSTNAAYGKRFILPTDSRTIIALGFSVLYAIDSGEEDFVTLLNDYFYEKNINGAYARFANELLVPFKKEVITVANAMINAEENEYEVTEASPAKKNLLSDEDISVIKVLLEQSKGVILQYKIEPNLKSELMTLYDNFVSELYDVEPEKIKAAFFGYKYGILFHKRHDAGLEKIAEILKKGGIL